MTKCTFKFFFFRIGNNIFLNNADMQHYDNYQRQQYIHLSDVILHKVKLAMIMTRRQSRD